MKVNNFVPFLRYEHRYKPYPKAKEIRIPIDKTTNVVVSKFPLASKYMHPHKEANGITPKKNGNAISHCFLILLTCFIFEILAQAEIFALLKMTRHLTYS